MYVFGPNASTFEPGPLLWDRRRSGGGLRVPGDCGPVVRTFDRYINPTSGPMSSNIAVMSTTQKTLMIAPGRNMSNIR
jgi:hypothetical protein